MTKTELKQFESFLAKLKTLLEEGFITPEDITDIPRCRSRWEVRQRVYQRRDK